MSSCLNSPRWNWNKDKLGASWGAGCCKTYDSSSRHAYRGVLFWWEGHVCQDVKIRQKQCIYNSNISSLLLCPFLLVYVSFPLPPNSPSLHRWPFRVLPRWNPRVHCAFRLSATFERPESAATYTLTHTHMNTHALSTQNLKRYRADIQMYIKCTNTHIHKHACQHSHRYTQFMQVSNLIHTAESLVWP